MCRSHCYSFSFEIPRMKTMHQIWLSSRIVSYEYIELSSALFSLNSQVSIRSVQLCFYSQILYSLHTATATAAAHNLYIALTASSSSFVPFNLLKCATFSRQSFRTHTSLRPFSPFFWYYCCSYFPLLIKPICFLYQIK